MMGRRAGALVGPARVHEEGGALRVEASGREEALRLAELCVEERVRFGAGNAYGSELKLDLRPSTGLLDLWPEDLVARFSAGTTIAAADTLLRPWGFRLGAELPMPDEFTLGACYARAENGFSAPAAGSLRERCLGLLAIDGRARLLKAGARVVKNVAGYDLARLHHGAHGAFGVLLDFVMRVESIPEASEFRAWPCAIGQVERELAARRAPRASVDPLQQIWLDPGASEGVGASPDGLLVLAHQGWASSVDAWGRELAGEALMPERIRDWGYANDESGRGCFRIACGPRVWLERWDGWRARLEDEGCRPRLLVDLLGGRHRLLLADARRAGWFFEELGEEGARWVGSAAGAGAQEIALRLKRSLDPHGLLPPLPQR